jgi:hypothetical protein
LHKFIIIQRSFTFGHHLIRSRGMLDHLLEHCARSIFTWPAPPSLLVSSRHAPFFYITLCSELQEFDLAGQAHSRLRRLWLRDDHHIWLLVILIPLVKLCRILIGTSLLWCGYLRVFWEWWIKYIWLGEGVLLVWAHCHLRIDNTLGLSKNIIDVSRLDEPRGRAFIVLHHGWGEIFSCGCRSI